MLRMQQPFEALYIHIPFCVKRCAYCDFSTQAVSADSNQIDDYVMNMVMSLRRASRAGLLSNIRTIYIGGGTPSYLGLRRLVELLYGISISVQLPSGSSVVSGSNVAGGSAVYSGSAGISRNPRDAYEFTMEANPDSFTPQMAKDIYAQGVNRLSIGVQSLDDEVLRTLGRVHDSSAAIRALDVASERFENVSADVICGIMGQSESSLAATLQGVLQHGVSHVSIYPLMVEDGTPLYRSVESGELPDIDDDVQADHMLLGEKIMQAAGLSRYEVASYCKPGFESRHNICYWTGKPYLGLGYGASSMLGAEDYDEVVGSGTLDYWLGDEAVSAAKTACGVMPPAVPVSLPAPSSSSDCSRVRFSLSHHEPAVEFLNERESVCEDAMLGMRMSRGLSKSQLKKMTTVAPRLEDVVKKAIDQGLVKWKSENLATTERGWLMGNELFGEIWDCAYDE